MRSLFLLLLILIPAVALGAEIPHAVATQTTEQSTTSTSFVDVPGVALTDGDFVDGQTYWIEVIASLAEIGNGHRVCVQLLHGSTTFEGSTHCGGRSAIEKEYYGWAFGVRWTAAAGEGVKLQFMTDGGAEVSVHFAVLRAMQLYGYLVEGVDYCYNSRATDDTLGTTATDGASCTITVGAASDLLVKTHALIEVNSATGTMDSRIVRSGEASSSTPQTTTTPDDTNAVYGLGLMRVYTVGTGSNTFKEQSQTDTVSAHVRRYSNVFVLNLNKFTSHGASYTDGSTTLSTTGYATQLESVSVTPIATGDIWIGASMIADKQAIGGDAEARIQVDGADALSGMTSASIKYDNMNVTHTNNDLPVQVGAVVNVSSGSRTIDFDASGDPSSVTDGKQTTLYAFTLDMPSGRTYILAPMVMQ